MITPNPINTLATPASLPYVVQTQYAQCASAKPQYIQQYRAESTHSNMDIEPEESAGLFPDLSTETVNDSTILVCTNTVCYLLSSVLPSLFTSPYKTDAYGVAPPPTFSEAGHEMHRKIRHFYEFTRQYTSITTAEVLHSIYLIDRLIQAEVDRVDKSRPGIVSEANLGTLLLVSVVLSTKVGRDTAYRNSWWAKVFGIPLSILNQSEVVFLKKIGWHVDMSEDNYWDLYETLLEKNEKRTEEVYMEPTKQEAPEECVWMG